MSISEALARAKEKKETCRCEKMTVRTAVPPCDHYTDADNRERARAEEKTKQQQKNNNKKKKERKERRRSSLRKKKHEKFNAAMRK